MKKKCKIILKSIMTFVLTIAMVLGVSMPSVYASGDTEENFTVKFKYEGKTDVYENVSSSSADFELSYILSQLEITGTVTEASVSEDQGMTVTTSMLTMSKPFGSGWLEVTVNGNKYHIVIETLPNDISVVLYGTLFFDKNGGSGEMVLTDPLDGTRKNAVYVKEYSNYQLPECGYTAPDGYEFSKWEINGNQYSARETYVFGQTTTAKAIWKLRDGAHSISATYETSEGEVIISPTMAVQGETVTVSVNPVAGKAVGSITYSYGTTSNQELILKSGETNVYEFTMPENDVTVSVTFKDVSKTPISYVDANGTPKSCDEYSFVRSNDTTWSGWVVASTNLTIDSRVNVSGTANLILMDGKTLTVTNGIQVGEGSTLNVYSQSENTGALAAGNPQNTYNAGIGGNKSSNNAGTITINGGKITAIGGYDSAGIGGASLAKAGTITIQGKADVTATSGKGAAGIGTAPGGIGGSVTITGDAKVSAVGTEDSSGGGAGIGGGRNGYCDSIVISGGTVTATSSYSSAAIGTSKSGKGGTISITGGNITATGIKGSSVGIGGQCNSVTIGGTAVVTATGNTNNAGIGGFEGDSADILVNIEGGTVKAYSSGNSGAAAIGSGNKAKGKTTINISGGTIEAYGNAIYGVGIGGGNTGSSTEVVNVNITGGDVTATGRTGIGTGNASEADQTITISGGIVKASGDTYNSNNGAAIGQGNNSKSHTVINIIGGKVSADGSGNGIGAGAKSNSAPTIKLRWTDENDEYTATNYIGNVTLEKSFKNKADNTEKFLPGDLTDNSILAGKTIVPADTSKNAVLMGDISYGKVIPEPRMQTAGQKVTLTVQTINGSELINDSLSVSYTVGSEMHTVELTQDSTDSNKYTFTMPDADVTVNASFISQWQKLQQQIDGDSTSIKLSGDVIAFEGEPAIRVPDGKTFTIDLNGHKIDRNLSYSIPDGYVMYVRGNLTVRDSSSSQTGTITGGNNKGLSGSACYGGGVQVEAQGSLTLESGSISENKSASYGGGVSIGSTSKFIMTGGSIVGNSAGYGAGIVAKDISTLTISGGTINNNTAGYFGGGIHVMSSAKFTMTGGSITENTAEKGAGGINYASYEKLMISGDANVINNTAGEKANNVYLQSGKVITIASEFTGNIGVTLAVAPTSDTPVVITKGLSGRGNVSNFTSDTDTCNLDTNTEGEAILSLAVHIHNFTYSSDGAVITATCTENGCTLTDHKATLTIAAPEGTLVYDGTVKRASVTGDTTVLGIPTIKYHSGTNMLDGAPFKAGNYTASITKGGKTARVEYEIAKATPNSEITSELNAIYGQTLADVSLPTGWTWNEPSTSVGDVGNNSYPATYMPTDTDNYNSKTENLTVAVGKAENPAQVIESASVKIGGNTVDLSANVSEAQGTVTYAVTDALSGCSVNESTGVFTSGNTAGDCTITVTIAGNDHYNVKTATITVTVKDKSTQSISFESDTQTKTYGDSDFTVTAIHSYGDGTVSYAVTEGPDVADVNSSTGEVTIKKTGTATITATAAATDDYAEATAQYTLTVNPKSVTIPAAVIGLKWTGNEQTGVADGAGYTVTNGKKTDVGSYTATVALKDKTNTKWSDDSTDDQSIAWSIGKVDGPAAPTGLTATAPTTDGGSDGKITGVDSKMEYSGSSSFTSKTDCAGTEITGLSAGTYYVRVKETETHEAGDYATVKVPAYVAPTYEVTYKVVGGTWSDDSTTNKTEIVQSGSKPASVPTGMKAGSGYMGGAWDKDPAEATITGATTFTYIFSAIPTYTVTYKVVGGTWSDDSTTNKTETVQSGSKPASVPTGMKAGSGYMGGAWDKDPAEATITGATTFTYTFTAKQAAIVKKAPTAKTLTYTGSAQELVTAGEATGGTMYYAAPTENTAPADNLYTTSIPTATNAGTYYVWYKVVGNENYTDYNADTPIQVVIAKSDNIPKNLPDKMSVSQSVDKIEQSILDAFVGWKWAEGEIGKEIPEGGSVSANAIYGGSDKDNYNITEATVEVSRANHDHTGGKATCHEQAVCEICGQPYGGLDATNHSGGTEIRDSKDVSCTEDGYTGDTYCLGCDTMIQKGTLIPAEGHVPAEAVKENKVTATCTTAGSYEEVVKCSVCGEEISRKTVTVPATGHNWDDWKVVKPATETEEGVEERVCKNDSSHKETRSIVKLEPKPATDNKDNPSAGNDTTTESPKPTEVPAAKGVTLEDAGTKAVYIVTSATGEEPTVEYKASESITDKKVIIPDSVTINGVTYKITKISDNAFAKNKKIEKVVLSSNIKSIDSGAFSGCTKLKSVTIPANVIEISDKAFKGCTSLTGIKIGNGVTKIGASAFEGCKKLKSVTIGSKVTEIGNNAFANCPALTKVTIPVNVTKIGKNAFKGDKKLKTITIKTTKLTSKNVSNNAFKGVGNKVTIKVPKKMKKAYTKLFRKKGLSKKVKIK